MEDEGKLRGEVDRGHRAKRIFEDELFQAAVEAVKDEIWKDFTGSALSDDKTRTMARLKLHCLDGVVTRLRNHVETGKLASRQILSFEKLKEKLR